ncbi:hypothetical protein QQ045_012459 [Rhodiola kirilowii]
MSHSWSMAEDVQLCVSYCRQSVDPITGKNQKIENLWKKIHIDFYNNWESNVNQPMAELRSQVSLASRFCKLKANLACWGSCLSYAERNKESGCNLQDEIRKAQVMYISKKKKEFIHFPCWDVVKDHQTFAHTETSTPQTYANNDPSETFTPSTNEADQNVSIEDLNFSTPEFDHINSSSPVRPPGVKAAKEAKRKGVQVASKRRDDALEAMAKNQANYIAWQMKKGDEEVLIQKDAVRLKRMDDEKKIMETSTEHMTPLSKKYFTKRKAQIMQQYDDDDDIPRTSREFDNCYRPNRNINFDNLE